jgi:hypothetical protein
MEKEEIFSEKMSSEGHVGADAVIGRICSAEGDRH